MNITVPIQKSIRFFIMIFPVFFALVKPASTIANPACIQNTNAAPIRNHTPNNMLEYSSISFPPFYKTKGAANVISYVYDAFVIS